MTTRIRRVRIDPLLIQAAIAGALSFSHLHDIAQAAGQTGWQAWAYPISVDLLLVAAWRRLVAARLAETGAFMAWLWFLIALAASLGANVATAGLLDLHHPPAWLRLTVAGWPAIAFLGGTLLVHRPAVATMHRDAPPVADEPPAPVEVFADVAEEPPPALPAPPTPPAEPAPGPAVPPALIDHARRIADTHHRTTGTPITPDALRARLGVPAPLADRIAAHLDLT